MRWEEGRKKRPQTQLEPALGGFAKQGGGEKEPREVWGTGSSYPQGNSLRENSVGPEPTHKTNPSSTYQRNPKLQSEGKDDLHLVWWPATEDDQLCGGGGWDM